MPQRLAYLATPHNAGALNAELIAAIPALAPTTGPDGKPLASYLFEESGDDFWLTVDNAVSSAAVDAVVAAHVSTVQVITNVRAVPVSLPQNALVNAEHLIAQRWTSKAGPSGTLTFTILDRWEWVQNGAGAVTGSQDASGPAVGPYAIHTPFSLKILVTTADASIAASDAYECVQSVEGYDYRALTPGSALSFWVWSAVTGIHCVSFRNRGADRSYVAEYTVNAANTWEYKTVTVPPPPTAGTWSYTNAIGLKVGFTLAAGTTFQTTPGTWQTGNFRATANQVNVMGTLNNTFAVALPNLIPGNAPQPLIPVPFTLAQLRCMRYYQLLGSADFDQIGTGFCINGTQAFITRPLAVPHGGNASLEVSAVSDLSLISASGTRLTCTAIDVWQASPITLGIRGTVASGLVAGNGTRMEVNAASKYLATVWTPV
jgi:hypothetical protein